MKNLLRTIISIATTGMAFADATPLQSSRVLANVDPPASNLFICRLLIFDIMYEETEDEELLPDFFMCNPVRDGEVSSQRYSLDLPPQIAAAYRVKVRQALSLSNLEDFYIGIPSGYVDLVTTSIVIPDPANVRILKTNDVRHRNLARRTVSSIGQYSLLVIRITDSKGNEPFHSSIDLYRHTFDAEGVSVKSQYEACSWGQFTLTPAGAIGVLDVTVNSDSARGDDNKLTLEAENEAMEILGVSNIFDYTDFVMFVTPPMGRWIAYASVGGGYSVYNSRWGGLVGATMHELGHNLGLLHSNEGTLGSTDAQYQDFSGYMGAAKSSYLQEGYPVQCFNAANHWELGWYEPTHALEVFPESPEIVYIGAFADRSLFSNGATFQEYAMIKSGDYFVQYNGAWGINKHTNEFANQLTVTRQWEDGTYAVGQVANEPGAQWTLSGSSWTVKVCEKANGSEEYAEVLTVWIGNGAPDCGSTDNYFAGNPGDAGSSNPDTCKDNTETCSTHSDCCSNNCRAHGSGLMCLPDPDSNNAKDRFRISQKVDERIQRRRTKHVRSGSTLSNLYK